VYAKKEGNAMRDAIINLRALPAQRDLIDRAANLMGKNRSDFMLDAACDKAQSVVNHLIGQNLKIPAPFPTLTKQTT
jgi:uncharacterized protein (DUF1778 family)